MMNTHFITWKKEYYEDLGEQDENSFLEYAYRYFIYSFYFHDGQEVNVRRYADTMNEYSIFLNSENRKDVELLGEKIIISAVVHFMKTAQGVGNFNYFGIKSNYAPVSLAETEDVSSNFLFTELT